MPSHRDLRRRHNTAMLWHCLMTAAALPWRIALVTRAIVSGRDRGRTIPPASADERVTAFEEILQHMQRDRSNTPGSR